MTTLSILNDDWEILFDDETVGGNAVAGMRMVRRAAGASATVYTSLALYSAIADAADEFQAMGFRNPALPVTPNAFTLENKYFMPRSSTEWLREGTWSADWSYTAAPNNDGNGVVACPYSIGMGADFVAGDVGRQVTAANGDTGTLLDFELGPDGTTRYAWIRPDDSTPVTGDLFDGTGSLSVTGDMGTGSVTQDAAGSIGRTRYTAFQAIGSVPTSTEVYVYQNRNKITDYQGNFQWWTTDSTVSLGIISILLRTHFQAAGFADTDGIAESDVEVFARRYTSLYDNFRLNVGAGGFSALPLASSPDINNTTGYRTLTGSAGSGTFVAGEEISEAVSGAQGVLTAVGGSVAAPVLEYYLIGNLTEFNSSGAQTITGADSGATCTSAAPSANTGGPTDTASGEGGSVTITLGHTTADHDGNGSVEPYSVDIDAQTNVAVAKVYERIKYATRRGAPNTDLFGAGVNIPGESYRGCEQVIWYVNPVGTMTQGDDLVTDPAGNWTARLMSDNATPSGEGASQDYIMVTDQQTSLASIADGNVIDDESGDSVEADTGGAGGAFITHASVKSSPFGTFTGTQIFGAPGILYSGIDNDPQAYILTDDIGTLRTPPNTVTILVDNTLALDRVYLARDTGVAGVIDKDQFGGLAAPMTGYNEVGDFFLRVAGTIDSEVPSAGWVRVIENTLQQEHHYVYDAIDGVNEEFDLRTAASYTGTATAGTSDTVLEDTGQTFVTHNVEVGMLVYVAGRTSTYEVTAVTDEDTLAIRLVYGAGGFVSTDTYTINALIQTYAATDDIHDVIIDAEATTTSISNTLVKTPAANFGVVVNVRQGKVILPFTQNATVGDSGLTVTTVRQEDTIAV
jgi:hypothetical protein